MKRLIFLFCGICWMTFGLAVGVFLVFYLMHGVGFEDYGFGFLAPMVSSGSVLMGFVHAMGFIFISMVSFAVGIKLCASGGEIAKSRPPKKAASVK